MADPAFSVEHRQQFRELRAVGELHAINLSPEQLDFGPWALGCDIKDHDTAERLKSRFRAAVRKAAVAAGAPPRANLFDWWICKLAREKRPYLQDLIQRSIELCEELEAGSIEYGWKWRKSETAASLRRDQYPTDFIVPYWLYDVPHDPLADSKDEFDFWEDHIWRGFRKLLRDLEKEHGLVTDGTTRDLRGRQPGETRAAFRNRVANRVSMGYYRIKPTFECLGFDLAVLLANYVIDRRLDGPEAMRAFDADSAQLVEKMNACWKESSRRLGLSWSKQVKQGQDGIDLVKPFRLVRNDLALLIPVPEDLTNLSRLESQPSLQTALALNESGNAGLGTERDAVDAGGQKPPLLNVRLIEAWMDDEGWINKTLAQKLHISERAVSSIRNNGNYHGADALFKLANLMGRDPEELYLPPEAST